MQKPLIELQGVGRAFSFGDSQVPVLQNIDLSIHDGEMVAIVGPSGCGKSTLMNILGCLDKPTCGIYRIHQKSVATLDKDQLADLRREYFGFIFQRYQLLNRLTACENVEVPAIYAGMPKKERQQRACELLSKLGLEHKTNYHPGQLSGGQQQRVSIARALMNGGKIILADEPTGALDSKHGQEVIQILQTLHQAGHTIILVTHDINLASYAKRIITMQDGKIISDKNSQHREAFDIPIASEKKTKFTKIQYGYYLREALKMAWRSILTHRMRSFLTMLGIIIGIASVVSIVAIGSGAQHTILSQLSGWGSKMLTVYPDYGNKPIKMFGQQEIEAISKQFWVKYFSPEAHIGSEKLRRKNSDVIGTVLSGGEHYFDIRDVGMAYGTPFNEAEVLSHASVAVLNRGAQKALFEDGENPIGQIVLIKNLPCRVVGVSKPPKTSVGDATPEVIIPYTTASSHLSGKSFYHQISVRAKEGVSIAAAKKILTKALTIQRGGKENFRIMSADDIITFIKNTTNSLTLLVSCIGFITLLVGGIGIMNIMLVSVTERTQEIGIRMAVGARQSNILQQFLIEAILICLIGGILGILLSFSISTIFNTLVEKFPMRFSLMSIAVACLCSTLIGIIFGFLPARNAARLDPAVTLNSN